MLVKLFLLAGMVQPFVHPCSGRYWPSFVALFGLAVGYVLTTSRRTADQPADDLRAGSPAAARAVAVMDVAATALAVVVAAVLLAVGR